MRFMMLNINCLSHRLRKGAGLLLLVSGMALLACACASSPATGPAAGANAFAKANMDTFRTFTLKNGIPVIVKINPDNRIYNLQLVLKGGTALTTAANAGIEGIMLNTMARGSGSWPYEKLMSVFDATSSGISAGAGFDAATYGLNTLDKYFDQVFPIWADTVTNPAFAQKDFD